MRMIDADRLKHAIYTDFWEHFTQCHDSDQTALIDMVMYDIDEMPTLTPPPITGDTSDGYHTFNELYHHRAILFSVICNARPDIAWKSKRHHDGTMYDGMFIVGIDTPEGQATYHYDIDPYWDLFHVKEIEVAPEWDGHTPDEAIRRIGTITPPKPNDPLTLEQLREMDGEPVYLVDLDFPHLSGWHIVSWNDCLVATTVHSSRGDYYDSRREYGATWICYRRPPDEEDA